MAVNTWRHLTPTLVFACAVFLQGALLFGIDTGSFGSLQALPSFLRRFGVEKSPGQYELTPLRTSLMNSLPWVGKISGCFTSERLIDGAGYKKSMFVVAGIQIVAMIIELTAHAWPQFTVGRILAYFAVGLVENIVPSYTAEMSPAETRGLLSGSVMMVTGLGNLWGSGMSQAYKDELGDKGWMIPTGMQLIPPVIMLLLVPWTPESPRWLLLKGRKTDAKASLDRIRTEDEVVSGATQAEADLIELAIEEANAQDQGTWLDLFRGNYLRRTWICATAFAFSQANGNQFVQSYAPTFYVQQGLGTMSFTYALIGQALGILGSTTGLLLYDMLGRRILLMTSGVVCCFLLFLASGLGTINGKNQAEVHTLVACFIILPGFLRIYNAFVTGAEIGGVRMRKKEMAFGTATDVLTAFIVTFCTPYVLPHLGSNIGWIFGSVAACSMIWAAFFFPELKGRSLEEVDELFEASLPAWRFKDYVTQGTASMLTSIRAEGVKDKSSHVED